MNATTTCTNQYLPDLNGDFLNLVAFDVTNPNHPFIVQDVNFDLFNVSVSPVLSTECVTVVSSSTPVLVRDDGNMIFGVGIIIVLLAMIVLGSIFTSSKKR